MFALYLRDIKIDAGSAGSAGVAVGGARGLTLVQAVARVKEELDIAADLNASEAAAEAVRSAPPPPPHASGRVVVCRHAAGGQPWAGAAGRAQA
jgi:hypothetical protein